MNKKAKAIIGAAIMSTAIAGTAFGGGLKDKGAGDITQAGSYDPTQAMIKSGEIMAASNRILEHFEPIAARGGDDRATVIAKRIVAAQNQLQSALGAEEGNTANVQSAIYAMIDDMSEFDLLAPRKPEWTDEVTLNGQIFAARAKAFYKGSLFGESSGYPAISMRPGDDFQKAVFDLTKLENNNGRTPTVPPLTDKAGSDIDYIKDIIGVRLRNEMPNLATNAQGEDRNFDDMFIDIIEDAGQYNRIMMETRRFTERHTNPSDSMDKTTGN